VIGSRSVTSRASPRATDIIHERVGGSSEAPANSGLENAAGK
jgi:hypothetical protein